MFFRYPDYVFISDNEISKTAGLGSRYSDASLRGVILDIHFMSLCDYLVCTFSSQVSPPNKVNQFDLFLLCLPWPVCPSTIRTG